MKFWENDFGLAADVESFELYFFDLIPVWLRLFIITWTWLFVYGVDPKGSVWLSY